MLPSEAKITVGLQALARLSRNDSRMTVLRQDLI